MNDGQGFDSLITFIDGELTALKTGHARPLGAIDFFLSTKTVTVNLQDEGGYYYKDFWIDVTIKTPKEVPPIVQTGWNTPDGFTRIDFLEYAVNSDYTRWSYRLSLESSNVSSATFAVSATSSLPVVSIGVRS